MARHIWVFHIENKILTRVTAPSEGYETYPTWSPDGSHILFKYIDSDFFDYGELWAVAANVENINLQNAHAKKNATPLRDDAGFQINRIYGPIYWINQ